MYGIIRYVKCRKGHILCLYSTKIKKRKIVFKCKLGAYENVNEKLGLKPNGTRNKLKNYIMSFYLFFLIPKQKWVSGKVYNKGNGYFQKYLKKVISNKNENIFLR